MRTWSVLLLLLFTAVASVDGFYFHIYRYRLYARTASSREHWLHTWNAVLFPFTIAPVYLATATGFWLWLAVALFIITFVIESLDVFSEGESRASLGGLTPLEYWMHFSMSGLRWGSCALAFASEPASAWLSPTSWAWLVPDLFVPSGLLPWGIAIVGLPVAGLHVLLGLQGAPRRLAERVLWQGQTLPVRTQ